MFYSSYSVLPSQCSSHSVLLIVFYSSHSALLPVFSPHIVLPKVFSLQCYTVFSSQCSPYSVLRYEVQCCTAFFFLILYLPKKHLPMVPQCVSVRQPFISCLITKQPLTVWPASEQVKGLERTKGVQGCAVHCLESSMVIYMKRDHAESLHLRSHEEKPCRKSSSLLYMKRNHAESRPINMRRNS